MIINATDLKRLLKSVSAKGDVLLDSKLGTITSISPELTISARTANFVSRQPFVLVADGRKLSQVVARMSGDIAIHLEEAALVLKSARATIPSETKAAKPFTAPPMKDSTILPLPEVKSLLAYTSGAVSKNIAEQFGGVVKLTAKDGVLQSAGTDGARLALAKTVCAGNFVLDLTIPMPAVQAIGSLEGDTLEVESTDSYLHFHAGSVDIYANRVSRDYPNYQSFIPSKFAVKYQVDADMFKNCLLTIRPLLEGPGEPGLIIHFLDNLATITDLTGAARDQADYTQLDPDETFEPTPATIRISSDSLLSFFANISGPVTISANGPQSPIWLEAGNKQMLLAVLAG